MSKPECPFCGGVDFHVVCKTHDAVHAADIARAVRAEREACAKVAENNKVGSRSGESELVSVRAHNFASDDIAAAIRARGNDAR